MDRKNLISLLILFLVINSVLIFYMIERENNQDHKISKVCSGEKCFFVEIAETPRERAIGLMNRNSLEGNEGMLFIFSESSKHSFWMKDTKIPLDIIWIDVNKRIVDIKSVEPCIGEVCEIYTPYKESLYVLEINSGLSEMNEISIGSELDFH